MTGARENAARLAVGTYECQARFGYGPRAPGNKAVGYVRRKLTAGSRNSLYRANVRFSSRSSGCGGVVEVLSAML